MAAHGRQRSSYEVARRRAKRLRRAGDSTTIAYMNWFKRDPEAERYYLFPGQGGRAVRRKRRAMIQWSLIVGLLVSVVLALAMYWLNDRHR